MIKLLICLLCCFSLAVAMLQLRQQQTELRHQSAQLQSKIETIQARIWSQQFQIALATATPAIADTLTGAELSLIPNPKLPDQAGNWVASPKPRKP